MSFGRYAECWCQSLHPHDLWFDHITGEERQKSSTAALVIKSRSGCF